MRRSRLLYRSLRKDFLVIVKAVIKVNDVGFVYDTDGFWMPPVNLKQLEIFNDYHRYLLVHGPRKSSKTWGICHKVLRHAFDVDNAVIAIVCKTIKNAKSSGVWTLLTTRMLPHWQKHCAGFKVTEGPKTSGDTKLSFLKIRNRHGGISEIQCHSLEHAAEVEAKFKGPAYSMFWLSEFDQYSDAHSFDIFADGLRMTPFVKFEDHQIICDCNPPDSGHDHWIYQKWFVLKDSKPKEGEDMIYREGLHRILVALDDNPQLDPRERREMEVRYSRRKALYARFVLGLWEQDIEDGHFSNSWNENFHVRGNVDGPEEEWETIVPTPQCHTLITGFDVGDVNHAFSLQEKVQTEMPGGKKLITSFHLLDELVVLKSKVSVTNFALACLEKIDFWIAYMKEIHNRELTWRHWSDTSAFNFRAGSGQTDAAIIFQATDERIALRAAPKFRGSNHDKVGLLNELLFLKRLVVSAQLHHSRTMFPNLRSGGPAEYVREDQFKHIFDAIAYPILSEAPTEMFHSKEPKTENVATVITASL